MTLPLGYSLSTLGEFPLVENKSIYRGISKKWGKFYYILVGLDIFRTFLVEMGDCGSNSLREKGKFSQSPIA